MHNTSQVQLDVTPIDTGLLFCQLLVITLLKPGDLFLPTDSQAGKPFRDRIQPGELERLSLPTQLDFSQGIILYGNAPIWLYASLIDRCRKAPWIACYNAPLGKAVVVKSTLVHPQVGDTIAIPTRNIPGIAIAIGGPPDSGKSILSHALCSTLSRYYPNLKVFLHRANWDGEGNWSHEMSALCEIPERGRQIVQTLIKRGEYRLHELPNSEPLIQSYFQYHAEATRKIRNIVDVAIVDLGGKPQEQKRPVVEQCTHYLIISSDPEKVSAWHQLLGSHLKPLAVLHSKAAADLQLPANSPCLEQTIDLGELIQTQQIPDGLLGAIAPLLEGMNQMRPNP